MFFSSTENVSQLCATGSLPARALAGKPPVAPEPDKPATTGSVARSTVWLALGAIFVAGYGTAAAQSNLLINGGFEQNNGIGTIPLGWQVDDELSDYFGWVAPRIERRIGEIWPRTGRFMAGLDTELMGVDIHGRDYDTPRAAIRQTVTVSGPVRGAFSVYFNDVGSTGLAYVSVIRLAYTIGSTDIRGIRLAESNPDAGPADVRPGLWSKRFHRVSQRLPGSRTATSDWTLASIPVVVDSASPVALTVWVAIFDNQDSTEVGYWRIDDAALASESPHDLGPVGGFAAGIVIVAVCAKARLPAHRTKKCQAWAR